MPDPGDTTERAERRRAYAAASDGQNQAFELAIIPALFGLAGYGLDRWVGMVPVFTIVMAIVAFVGLGVRAWYQYDAKMGVLERDGLWNRSASGEVGAAGSAGGRP